MNNIVSDINQILVIHPTNILSKVKSIDTFSDDVSNETSERFFEKKWRFSTNGFVYSEWSDISTITTIVDKPVLILQFQYIRRGTDATGELIFNSLDLDITFNDCNSPYFQNSVFHTLLVCCCEEYSLKWCLNVLEKVYERGIVPKTIRRFIDQDDEVVNEDYIHFWKSVCCFFSIFVGYANVFANYPTNSILLKRYVEKMIFICIDQTDEDLLTLLHKQYNIVTQRGTINTINRQNKHTGELIRLLCNNELDFNHHKISLHKNSAWNIGNNSPLTRQVVNHLAFNLINDDYAIFNGASLNNGVYTLPSNSAIGVDIPYKQGIVLNNPITIDPCLDFNFNFKIKADVIDNSFTVGAICFDSNNNVVTCLTLDGDDENYTFLSNETLPIADQYYNLNFNIYKCKSTTKNRKLFGELGYKHKVFDSTIVKVVPFIKIDRDAIATWTVKDLFFGLMLTEYSRGFISNKNLLESVFKNKNFTLSNFDLQQTVRRYLISYNADTATTFI